MMNCKVCDRDDLAVIEGAIRGNTSLRAVAGMFGLSKDAVHRHKVNHMIASNGAAPEPANTASLGQDRRDAAFERDYWTLVACFSPGVPQRNGNLRLTETVRAWSQEKKNKVFQEALERGDLVQDRRGEHIERPQARHVSGETVEN